MDERYAELAVHLQDVDSRCKSNQHRIEEHDNEIHTLRERQEAIYDLASSVKSIATDMTYIKEDVKEVKSGQEKLNEKVTILENKPAVDTKKRFDIVFDKLIWIIIGGIFVSFLSTILPSVSW